MAQLLKYNNVVDVSTMLLLLLAVLTTSIEAFGVVSFPFLSARVARQSVTEGVATAPAATRQQDEKETVEILKHDIAELKEQAAQRLDALLEQFEELKSLQQTTATTATTATSSTAVTTPKAPAITKSKEEAAIAQSSSVTTVDQMQRPQQQRQPPQHVSTAETQDVATAPQPYNDEDGDTADTTIAMLGQPLLQKAPSAAPLNLLDDTVWKVVFNIGRETGTWMPKDWGSSGDRLLFQCTVEFTSETVLDGSGDEFFQGALGVRKLLVTDAFVIPRGVGPNSVGRRPLPVLPTGAYKVCRNIGPAGTDIVRLFVELTAPVTVPDHVSDVYCPAERVYGTAGYFAIPYKHDPSAPSHRDLIQQEHNEAIRNYEQLQLAVDMDERGMLNLDHLQKMKEAWQAKKVVEETAAKLQLARQREPEKAQLRLNKSGTVGLTKEGGVCCKVHKGLALEYHILGRMEVGCIEDHQHHSPGHGPTTENKIASTTSAALHGKGLP